MATWRKTSSLLTTGDVTSHLLHPFLWSLVEDGRVAYQGVGRVRGVAGVRCHAPGRGRHGSSRLAHGGHGPALLEHASPQDPVVVMVVVARCLALLPILRLYFDLWPQRGAVSPSPTWQKRRTKLLIVIRTNSEITKGRERKKSIQLQIGILGTNNSEISWRRQIET